MPLPHPHGNGVGQIAHGSVYSETDTPGSTGGRFIGFGEEGTSQIANRAAWALSQNIDWLYQRMISSLASPQYESWAGGAAQYLLASGATVWCGDSGYSAARQLDIDQLFSVLDAQYNQLQDDLGNKVVVKEVRNTGDTQNVVGTGFVAQPLIRFQTVDPLTGSVVSASYALPAGTYYILHGRAVDLSSLPTDILTKLAIRVGEEIPAGVFLQNGSRKLTGHLDANGKNLTNVLGLSGKAGQDLSLSSYQAMNFNDAYLSTPAALSESGETLVEKFPSGSTSIAHSLNSSKRLRAFVGNRVLNRGGAITFTDGTGAISLPAMVLSLNGEGVATTSATPTATPGAARVLVYDQYAQLTDRLPSAVVETDIPLVYYYWNGSAFTTAQDIRWPYQDRGESLEVTVGPTGCDFQTLKEAVEFVDCTSNIRAESSLIPLSWQIRLVGSSNVTSAISADSPMRIYGEGLSSRLMSTVTGADMLTGGSGLILENFRVTRSGAADPGMCAIKSPGDNSHISGIIIDGTIANGIDLGASSRVVVSHCKISVSNSGVLGSTGQYNVVRDCLITPSSATPTGYGVALLGDNCLVENNKIGNAGSSWYFLGGIDLGNGGTAKFNKIELEQASVVNTRGIRFVSSGSIPSCTITDNYILGGEYGGHITLTAATPQAQIIFSRNNLVSPGLYGCLISSANLVSLGSVVEVSNNKFLADNIVTATSGIYVSKVPYCCIGDNHFHMFDTAVTVLRSNHSHIGGNQITGYIGGISIHSSSYCKINNNNISEHQTAAPGYPRGIYVGLVDAGDWAADNNIYGNTIRGSNKLYYGIQVQNNSGLVEGTIIESNHIYGGTGYHVHTDGTHCTVRGNKIFVDEECVGSIYVGDRSEVIGNKILGQAHTTTEPAISCGVASQICHNHIGTYSTTSQDGIIVARDQYCTILSNYIGACSVLSNAFPRKRRVILINGQRCQIIDNEIDQLTVGQPTGDTPLYLIDVNGAATVVTGNRINMDVVAASNHCKWIYGICVRQPGCHVAENQIDFAVTWGVPNLYFIVGIWTSGDYTTITGNRLGDLPAGVTVNSGIMVADAEVGTVDPHAETSKIGCVITDNTVGLCGAAGLYGNTICYIHPGPAPDKFGIVANNMLRKHTDEAYLAGLGITYSANVAIA